MTKKRSASQKGVCGRGQRSSAKEQPRKSNRSWPIRAPERAGAFAWIINVPWEGGETRSQSTWRPGQTRRRFNTCPRKGALDRGVLELARARLRR
ncbi:hypothetical protein KFL_002600220 [Klebsormidium nitens]|uniref:Uncharacterized protein n=1 Tax=Klebsormidium nitens TaxID=105231 RepID=A0A1Y1I4P3_KLENI|nr:hypothetical protein KFL_002600220 [Klebsormidium nitens]|eukprot:GAQ85914.1 hypothetical protein KFL_002600220 [Klebsormidium nitens]